MKNFKKFTAFVLALCMLFSLSVSAFAAEKTPTGFLTWTLDDSGTLSISGNGRIAAFTSAEDQPWHDMRENITSVKFDSGAHMIVPDVTFWFSGCTNHEIQNFCASDVVVATLLGSSHSSWKGS